MRRLAVVLLLCGCYSEPTAPAEPDALFTAICIDSTLVHPAYACHFYVDSVTIYIEIPNPNPGT